MAKGSGKELLDRIVRNTPKTEAEITKAVEDVRKITESSIALKSRRAVSKP